MCIRDSIEPTKYQYLNADVPLFSENRHEVERTVGLYRVYSDKMCIRDSFYTMRQNYKPYKIPTFGYPKLRLNLIVEYADGSKETIATNTSWKLTTEGPIRSNNEYDGEEYDARKELGAWTQTGYDDKNWMPAQRAVSYTHL